MAFSHLLEKAAGHGRFLGLRASGRNRPERAAVDVLVEGLRDSGQAVTFNNLGNVSESEDRPLEAIEWHAKAKEIRSTLGPRANVAVAYTTLNMSRALVMLDRHEEARQCLSETLSLFGTEISWFYLA